MTFHILKVLSFIFIALMTVAKSDISSPSNGKNLGSQDSDILKQDPLHRRTHGSGDVVECCPTLERFIEPEYGTNNQGYEVRLYRDRRIKQGFTEYLCKSNVIDAACSSFDPSLVTRSKCVQQFLLTPAIVQGEKTTPPQHKADENETYPRGFVLSDISEGATRGGPWKLGYITLRCGCNFVNFVGSTST